MISIFYQIFSDGFICNNRQRSHFTQSLGNNTHDPIKLQAIFLSSLFRNKKQGSKV